MNTPNEPQKLPWVTPVLRRLPATNEGVLKMLAALESTGEEKRRTATG